MTQFYQMEFERPVRELDARIADAERTPAGAPALGGVEGVSGEPIDVESLRVERERVLADLYAKLTPWDAVRVARHPGRPQSRDYIDHIARDFCELHGDRHFGDDPAIITGFGRIGNHKCLIVGHQKGRDTQEKLRCHFGCAHPEGYRKAMAKMKLAEKFGLPIVTLVDTPGAYPGIGAEQRGQAEAIAVNLRDMSRLKTPILSIVIGEGGSGGALGIAVADRVAMMQFAWYSVISPEGCAAILWKQANERTNAEAARALRLTASDNLELGVIESIIPEPVGAAHRNPSGAAAAMQAWITDSLDELAGTDPDELIEARYQRFRKLGAFGIEQPPEPAPQPDADAQRADGGPQAATDAE